MPFTVTMPKLSPTMEEGTITKWRKREGERVAAGDVLFEVATDKATVEYNALDPGVLRKILVQEGQPAPINTALCIFTEKAEESIEGYLPEGQPQKMPEAEPKPPSEKKEEEAPKTVSPPAAQPTFAPEPPLKTRGASPTRVAGRTLASPLARRLAEENNIDLSSVKGSGPHGRVVARDLASGQSAGVVTFGAHELPDTPAGSFEEEPLSPMRKVIAKRLQESKTYIPHFYVSQEIRVDSLEEVRAQLKNGGLKISVNDFIVRASALALREHPNVNSGFNSTSNQLIRFKTIDISIAVSLPDGLITPIVRHADYKNLGQISAEVRALAERAKMGKLAREEYAGGSFTISNLGMFGISDFVAIINPPQAAILAVGGIEEKPVVKNGTLAIGKTIRLTLSADHRVFDGTAGAKFLKSLQKYLENPALLIV